MLWCQGLRPSDEADERGCHPRCPPLEPWIRPCTHKGAELLEHLGSYFFEDSAVSVIQHQQHHGQSLKRHPWTLSDAYAAWHNQSHQPLRRTAGHHGASKHCLCSSGAEFAVGFCECMRTWGYHILGGFASPAFVRSRCSGGLSFGYRLQ